MPFDLTNFKREAAYLNEIMADGVARLHHGSYAQRHPGQGRMVRCPLCGRRRRELPLEPCCNTEHAMHEVWNEETQEFEIKPRVVEALVGKAFFKRFKHKRHSNKLRHQIHDLSIKLQDETFRNTTQYILEGLPGFWKPSQGISIAHIPAFAERVIRYERKQKANAKRKRQKESRRINRP